MKYEKTQKSNPHQLTLNQHVFPKRSIDRFLNEDGAVETYIKTADKNVLMSSENPIFCARRVWDQRAEHGYMKEIEDEFQALADTVINGDMTQFSDRENDLASSFFCLWDIRVHFRNNPIEDKKLQGIVGVEFDLSKDEEESLEKAGIGYTKTDLSIPGRQIAGGTIQITLNRCRKQFNDATWGILRSEGVDFIVPDRSAIRMIPLNPMVCLYSPSRNKFIDSEEVAWINRMSIKPSFSYYFARELNRCPGIR